MRDVFGVLGLFQSEQELLDAIPKLREKGFSKIEAYTPYPVHGLDKALGIPRSKVGILVFIMAAIGGVSAFAFEWWTSTVSYPLITAGKAYNGWQAWIPVVLEATILFGTFTAGLGTLFVFNKLPFFGDPVSNSKASLDITRDRFALMLMGADEALDTEDAAAVLTAVGAEATEVVPLPHYERTGAGWWVKTVVTIAAACVVAGSGVAWAERTVPRVRPWVEMADQPRVDAQAADSFFADGRSMQLPPTGTVARVGIPILDKNPNEAGKHLVNPLPVTRNVLRRGQQQFNIHCAVCHDRLGTGKPWLDKKYTAKPANLQSRTIRRAPDGWMYWVISKGYGTMPGYAADISQDDRWEIVHYVRALQRSQNAFTRDVSSGPQQKQKRLGALQQSGRLPRQRSRAPIPVQEHRP